jgi:hypothetical protein
MLTLRAGREPCVLQLSAPGHQASRYCGPDAGSWPSSFRPGDPVKANASVAFGGYSQVSARGTSNVHVSLVHAPHSKGRRERLAKQKGRKACFPHSQSHMSSRSDGGADANLAPSSSQMDQTAARFSAGVAIGLQQPSFDSSSSTPSAANTKRHQTCLPPTATGSFASKVRFAHQPSISALTSASVTGTAAVARALASRNAER